MTAMIGQLRTVAIDCPDPRALAGFYAELLGLPLVEEDSDGNEWVVLGGPIGQQPRLAFQQAPDLVPPAWPDPARPQQFHLDVTVDDIEVAEKAALALGARRLPGEGDGFRVYADPVGHPFCLCWD
ncbi:VOC family protein [Micromonospora sp. HM134]|nr:VOC family protein [Micromonospora sp. HM134]